MHWTPTVCEGTGGESDPDEKARLVGGDAGWPPHLVASQVHEKSVLSGPIEVWLSLKTYLHQWNMGKNVSVKVLKISFSSPGEALPLQ